MKSEEFANMKTVEDWIRQGAEFFEAAGLYFGHGTDNAFDEAAVLIAWVLGSSWEELQSSLANTLTPEQTQQISQLFKRRVEERIPAAYLTGEAWFAGYKFKVNADVLVPRSPIAELIQNEFRPWIHGLPGSILDLCCGSGCIGIASAHAFPEAHVVMTDISAAAIAIARDNIALHGLQDRVEAKESDGFAQIRGNFDLIVSNPPYVDTDDLANMPDEYRAEPEIGLASGRDGLEFTRHILKNAARFLNQKGSLIVEVGNSAEALEELLPKVPFMWPEFEYGGHGVFVLSRDDLLTHKEFLDAL